jgi:phosphohistidine swiveling domain-containing protein
MSERWIYSFAEDLPLDRAGVHQLLGGKGASLKEMTHARLPVPPGFTLATDCCEQYFALGRHWPAGLEEELRRSLTNLEQQAGRRFGDPHQPLLVSVRSGAAVSMPGMMDTLLNCGRPEAGDPWQQLVAAINAVFESWLGERAVAYRQHHDIRGLKGTAVTVQAMFPSEISGIAFTQDPTDWQAQRVVIEAAYGLGEVIVSGEVTPDRFLLPRDDLAHMATTAGKHGHPGQPIPCLSPAQVQELARIALSIEEHFGHPVDIEWGFAAGRFALLQSRPIRGLEVLRAVEPARLAEIERLRQKAGPGRRVWVAHNLGETLRFPTPLTWDIIRRFMSGTGGFGLLYQQLGYRPSKRVCRLGFLQLIGGRIYADPDRLAELFWEGMPLAYDQSALLTDRSILDRAPTKFEAAKADGLFLLRLPGNLWGMWRVAQSLKRGRRDAKRRFEEVVLPAFLRQIAEQKSENLPALDDNALLVRLHKLIAEHLGPFAAEALRPGFFGAMAFAALEALLVQLMGQRDGAELARTLTLALDGDVTFEQDAILYRVAQGQADLATFLERFGHRSIGEMELSLPRWREQADYLQQTVARLHNGTGRSPEEIHQQGLERYREARARLPQTLQQWGGSCFRAQIEADLDLARALLPYRESGKFYLMMGYEVIRATLEELARRWDLGRDLYFLELDELPRYGTAKTQLAETIAQRRLRWQALQKLDLPELIDSADLDNFGKPPPLDASQTELTGTAMAPGVASGPVRVVLDPQQPGELGTGYVLVCPSTDPGWTPLFLQARGLIVERGGVLSHGAIVARDFGIPAVACPNATRLLNPGAMVRVDGNAGTVVLLEKNGR